MENVADRDATDWLRRGALHWASLALLEDAAQNSTDHLGESWAMGLPTLPVDGGTIKVSIEDAQGRFNLNSVVNPASRQVLDRLLQVLRLDPMLSNAVLDWIDSDDLVRPGGGAEDMDYLNLNPPYRAANRPMASVDELRLIRGFDAKTVAALLPYVTVLPVATSDINVNTASPVVLAALVPGLDLPTAQHIAEDRDSTPYKTVNDFTSKLPRGSMLPTVGMVVKTDFFLVTLETSIGRHERRTEALLQRLSNKSTTLIWHRPQPLIGSDEADESPSSMGSDEPGKSP